VNCQATECRSYRRGLSRALFQGWLDYTQEPQDEDQQEQTAKTDIHKTSRFVLLLKRALGPGRSSRFATVLDLLGYDFTRLESTGFA